MQPQSEANVGPHMRHAFAISIKRQKAMIRKCGYEPSWELFSETLGWYQMRQVMSEQAQQVYEQMWKS